MIIAGCWRSTPAPTLTSAPVRVSTAAEDDATLVRDIARIDEYLDKAGAQNGPRGVAAGDTAFAEKAAFATVEIVGWTAENALVYRSVICESDEEIAPRITSLVPYCMMKVCDCHAEICILNRAFCDTVIYERADNRGIGPDPGWTSTRLAMIRAAEAAYGSLAGGSATSATLKVSVDREIVEDVRIEVGNMAWQALRANWDMDGFSSARLTAAQQSPDGRCVGAGGTTFVHFQESQRAQSAFGSVHCLR
jgi:hypothetical protein